MLYVSDNQGTVSCTDQDHFDPYSGGLIGKVSGGTVNVDRTLSGGLVLARIAAGSYLRFYEEKMEVYKKGKLVRTD